MNKYRVEYHIDNEYAVYEKSTYFDEDRCQYMTDEDSDYDQVYIGSLANCEAYIRLKTNKNVEFNG